MKYQVVENKHILNATSSSNVLITNLVVEIAVQNMYLSLRATHIVNIKLVTSEKMDLLFYQGMIS